MWKVWESANLLEGGSAGDGAWARQRSSGAGSGSSGIVLNKELPILPRFGLKAPVYAFPVSDNLLNLLVLTFAVGVKSRASHSSSSSPRTGLKVAMALLPKCAVAAVIASDEVCCGGVWVGLSVEIEA